MAEGTWWMQHAQQGTQWGLHWQTREREKISNRGRQASATEIDTAQQEARSIRIKVAKYMQWGLYWQSREKRAAIAAGSISYSIEHNKMTVRNIGISIAGKYRQVCQSHSNGDPRTFVKPLWKFQYGNHDSSFIHLYFLHPVRPLSLFLVEIQNPMWLVW